MAPQILDALAEALEHILGFLGSRLRALADLLHDFDEHGRALLELGSSVGTPNALSPLPPTSAGRHDRAPGGPRQARLPEGEALLRRGAPSTTRPWRRSTERGQRPNAGGRQTRANAQSQGGATERQIRLLRRAWRPAYNRAQVAHGRAGSRKVFA